MSCRMRVCLIAGVISVSPASINFDETMSTLRYANQAKMIVNRAVVNEDPTAALIKELRKEIMQLRTQVCMPTWRLAGNGLALRVCESRTYRRPSAPPLLPPPSAPPAFETVYQRACRCSAGGRCWR